MLDAGLAAAGEILVLQPRRLPARLAAARVAEELGEKVGERVGYTVRFDDVAGPRTRVRFITEGILSRRLIATPTLPGVSAVILDEFHERHLDADMAIGLLRRLQAAGRPDLRIVVMSATLDTKAVCDFLGGCTLLRAEGRVFPVQIEHQDTHDARPLAEQVAGAVRTLCRDGLDGDVLVFLPGAADIRRAGAALQDVASAQDLQVLPLHGELSSAEQDRAVRPGSRRKVILSTNVAETSVTIDGVVAVIDSGLARIADTSPWTRLPMLATGKISQAAAIQRAGRAGRTRPGRVLRLYSRHDFEGRRAYEVPEIARLDLAGPALLLAAIGVRDSANFDWFESPPPGALASASELLRRLGALSRDGGVTAIGRDMLRFPLHPRLARLVVDGFARGVADQAATLAALIAERDIDDRRRPQFAGGHSEGRGHGGSDVHDADLLERLDRFSQAHRARFSPDRLRALALDGRATEAVDRARRQIAGMAHQDQRAPSNPDAIDQALALATLAGFPDRVARRRTPGGTEVVFAAGGSGLLGSSPSAEWVVAVDAEERGTVGAGRNAVSIRLAVGIDAESLLEILPDEIKQEERLVWNAAAGRVDRMTRLALGVLGLEETRRPAEASAEASRLLAEAALNAGPVGFASGGAASEQLVARLEVLRAALPEEQIPLLDAAATQAALVAACAGLTSFAELRASGFSGGAALTPKLEALLRAQAPERLRLPGGREVAVNYEAGKPPWIASRMQDFFGLGRSPAVARGRVPLTLHLLGPHGRAMQVTSDLANFWQEHYPVLRRELARKYPRHSWPENGATATPPPPPAPRRSR